MTPLILVYDIGTTGLKCVVFDENGDEAASISIPYATAYPAPGRAEQDAEEYWRAAVRATKALFDGESILPRRIVAVGLSGHMNGCLPVDGEGTPLHRELIHSDSRSGAECAEILGIVPLPEVYALTGNRVDEHLSLPKILWIKNHRPQVYRRTAYFLNSKDYLRFNLTGVLGETDYSDASLVSAMDLQSRCWADAFIRELGLDPAKFPRIRESTALAGGITREAAAALGLAEGVPVFVGTGDAACATRGAGVTDSLAVYAYIGSNAWISTLAETPCIDPGMRIQNFFDLDGRKCNICGTVQSAGIAADWVISLVSGYPVERGEIAGSFEAAEAAIRGVPAGSDGVIFAPYLMGERTPHWDASTRGAFLGLSLYHGSAALMRAVFEGVAFALRDVLEVYDELGFSFRDMTLLGGVARSSVWSGIIHDVLGLPVVPHAMPTGATSLGAAMAAGVGVGLFPGLDEASRLVRRESPLEASEEGPETYSRLYPVYRAAL